MVRKKLKIFLSFLLFLFLVPGTLEAVSLGEEASFYIDEDYDFGGRDEIEAVLKGISNHSYFYVDSDYWAGLDKEVKREAEAVIKTLAEDMEEDIYPDLASTYCAGNTDCIDDGDRVFVLFHPMDPGAAGYSRTVDSYERIVVTTSNDKRIVYLNAYELLDPVMPSYLAHEITHLVTFDKKSEVYGVSEERWLNEARSEYTPTLLGYDVRSGEESNLARRVKTFLESPSDSLTEWKNEEADYGVLNIFTQYLVEKYGVEILSDSLHMREVGIESVNKALEENGHEERFSDIFLDFLVATYANDCSLGKKYCFKGSLLSGVKVTPQVNFLPLKGSSSLGVNQEAKSFEGNWYKFTGGKKGALKVQFIGNPDNEFRVAYLVRDYTGEYSLSFMELNEEQRGKILVPGFGTDVSSVTLIPLVSTKKSDFSENEEEVPFFWEATTITEEEELDKEKDGNGSGYIQRPMTEMSRGEILAKIAELENLLSQLRDQLLALDEEAEPDVGGEVDVSCGRIESALRIGAEGDEVSCLQSFLKNQGEEIYPEGLVTGYFGSLTQAAVIRFQERWREEVLSPWDLERGTGFVGETTREKINDLIDA